MYVANAGDSRCVMAMKNGTIKIMSMDHKPLVPCETLRILRAGSIVSSDGRVDFNLNLSRAIGDFAHKSNPKLMP